ncbi:MAG: hypothetical protein AB7T31_06680 [Gemmatimonadales bacterium]
MPRAKRLILVLTFSSIASAAQASAAQAQDTPRVIDRAAHAIVLGVGTTTTVGYAARVGARTDVGLEGSARLIDDDGDAHAVAVRPWLARYWSSEDTDVAPYVVVGLVGTWTETGAGAFDASSRDLGGFLGIGLDWFPHRRVSVGGHLALEAVATRRTVPLSPAQNARGFDIGTRSSGVRVRLFF